MIQTDFFREPRRETKTTRQKQANRDLREHDWGTHVNIARGKGNNVYGVICPDCPWDWEAYSARGEGRSAKRHYKGGVMSTEKIMELPVAQLAYKNCVLLLWAINDMLPDAFAVMKHWGFTYKMMFVWGKIIEGGKIKQGTGYIARSCCEFLLYGTKGNPVAPAAGKNWPSEIDTLIKAPVDAHSRKPEVFYHMIREYWPHVPKLEMFARRPRDGWDVHGDEVIDSVPLPPLGLPPP